MPDDAPASPPIEGVGLFAPLEGGGLAALSGAARVLDLARGQELDAADGALIVLLRGAMAMMVGQTDRRAVMAMIAAPSALNLAEVMAGGVSRVRWRALAPSQVLLIPDADVRAALRADPRLAMRAFGELAGAYQRLLDWGAAQRLRSAQQRVAAYLLSLTTASAGEAVVDLPYEKHLLASLLGMTPENFSRALGRLAPLGVRVSGARLRLARVEALRDLVESPLS